MQVLLRLIDRLSAAAAVVAAACLALLAVVILAEVVAIAVFRRSLDFTWEYGSFLMAAAFFLGLAWTLNSGGHVRVRLLQDALPVGMRRAVDLMATLTAFAVAAFLTTALAKLALGSYLAGSRTFTVTATPLAIPQAVVALGAALLCLQLAARAIRLVANQPPETAEAPAADDPA